ncbi:hypothetical protein TeGR_g2900, partial [Tetraparma gracilis]
MFLWLLPLLLLPPMASPLSIPLELISDTMGTHPDLDLEFPLHRVPFFLEPSYAQHGKAWSESHTSRMLRKFGSQAQFDAVIASQDLPGRGAEVGLDAAGFVQENLSKRQQSDTTDSHRLVIFVARECGLEAAEAFYKNINVKCA